MATKTSNTPDEFARDIDQFMSAAAEWPQLMLARAGVVAGQALVMLAGDASQYPEKLPNQRYRRTGTLGRLWTQGKPVVKVSARAMRGTIGNATPYGHWVQDPDKQAEIHKGRWRTTQNVLDERRQTVVSMFERANVSVVNEVAKKGMGG